MSAADDAYRAAQDEISRVREAGEVRLLLNEERFFSLEKLPDEVSELTEIVTLNIANTRVSDLSPLIGMKSITWLSLNDSLVKDLSVLAGMKQLSFLSLENTMVNDLRPIHACTELLILSIRNTEVNDLSPLASILGLRSLHADKTGVRDLSPLAGMHELTTLWLDDTKVDDLSPLAGMTEVTSLWLDRTRIQDLSPIASMTKLEWLSVDRTDVRDLAPLAGMRQLEALWISHTQVTDLRPLTSMPKLVLSPTYDGLLFSGCAAALEDKRIGEIAEFKRPKQRARTLFKYLETWVPPLPTDVDEQSTAGLRYRVGSKGAIEYDPGQLLKSATEQQRTLHRFLIEDTAELIIQLGGGHNQPHATVVQKLKRYETGLGSSLADLNTMVVWKVGNDLRLILEADKTR